MAIFSKSNVPRFSVDVYQNEYLPEGGRLVNAVVTVTATGGGTIGSAVAAPHLYSPGEGPSAAVVLMVDCSGSMDHPPTKMRNARDATAAAIDTLRDGRRGGRPGYVRRGAVGGCGRAGGARCGPGGA
ncbi:hypothetical protein ACWGKO_31700, partial [Streptomyces griseoincarnatus]